MGGIYLFSYPPRIKKSLILGQLGPVTLHFPNCAFNMDALAFENVFCCSGPDRSNSSNPRALFPGLTHKGEKLLRLCEPN